MEWSDLRYVLALSRAGSMVGAARALGVEHTTVSRRIAAVEKHLGARLFVRGPDGQLATAAGEHAIATAEAVEREILALEAAVAGEDDRPEGTVRVTTSDGFVNVVGAHLARLYSEYPAIRVELLTGNRVFDLTRGEADVAVRFVPTTQPDLIVRRVGTVGWALFGSAASPDPRLGHPPDCAGHRFIGFDAPINTTPGGAWLLSHEHELDVVLRANTLPAASAAVATGIGLGCLPCLLADRDPRLRRVSRVVAEGVVWLVAHPDRRRCARVGRVWDFLLDVLERERGIVSGQGHPIEQ